MASIYFDVFHIMKIKSEANSGGLICCDDVNTSKRNWYRRVTSLYYSAMLATVDALLAKNVTSGIQNQIACFIDDFNKLA